MAIFERKKKPPIQSENLQQEDRDNSESPIYAVLNPVVESGNMESTVEIPAISQSVEIQTNQESSLSEDNEDRIFTPPISSSTESPVEQKIQQLMDHPINGWRHVEFSSRNGMPVRLSKTPDGDGIVGYWKRTRTFHAKRWQETGIWCDFITTSPLNFDPLYWKPRFD